MGQRKKQTSTKSENEPHLKTPTFLLELPLRVEEGTAKRLSQMRADPAWQQARAIPRSHKQARARAFAALRKQYGYSEYALHEAAKHLRVSWIAEHLDAVLAQTMATRAYRALNRVCLGQDHRVRFKSRGRGLGSLENKRNDTGLRFVLQKPEEGNQGFLIWKDDQFTALIDRDDPVVKYGLDHPIKYARLVQRKASLSVFCEELFPNAKAIRRLQRQMDRQHPPANPSTYHEQGRTTN